MEIEKTAEAGAFPWGAAAMSGGLITTAQAAQLILMTPERVRQLSREGWFPKAERGKFHLVAVVQGYIRFLKDAERRASKSAVATRMQDIKTQKAELELAAAQKDLLPREDLLAAVDVMSAAVKNEMLGLPARITRDPQERAALDDEVRHALNRISNGLERSAGIAVAGGDVFEGSGA